MGAAIPYVAVWTGLYAAGSETKKAIDAPGEMAKSAAADAAIKAKAAKAAQAQKAAEAQAAADKIVADKKKADEEAKKKQTLLARRRRGVSPYRTPGGAMGILGQAPVQLKSLLGQ